MAALLDLHPESTHSVFSGVAEIEAVLDRMLGGGDDAVVGENYGAAVTA
jgi:hypothetical protein